MSVAADNKRGDNEFHVIMSKREKSQIILSTLTFFLPFYIALVMVIFMNTLWSPDIHVNPHKNAHER